MVAADRLSKQGSERKFLEFSVFRDLGRDRSGIVTFTHESVSASRLKASLREMGINVSVTSLSSTRIDMESRGLESMVRASVHYYNSEEELDWLVGALRGF